MEAQIDYYFARFRGEDGNLLYEKMFVDSIPIMNRRQAYRWLKEKQAVVLEYLCGDMEKYMTFLNKCSLEIGFGSGEDECCIDSNHLQGYMVRTRGLEYHLYDTNGYNTGGDPYNFQWQDKSWLTLMDCQNYCITIVP